ncbi:hypothetical protein BKA62DRAFT_706661 [Auriculariales sp. MPI-PUGE-AT-0066]|nr:hypothetical protein BKA62DRAFT_706661 [Auriculariales sp. MPI-PUGE-AT-0066]
MFGSLVPDLTDPYVSSWDASTATTGLELQTGAEMLGSSAPWDVSGGGFDMIFTAPHTLPAHWAEDAVTQNNAGAPGFDYNFDVDLTTLQEITDQWLADNPTPDSLLQLPHGEATFPSLLMSPPPPPHEQSEQSLPSYFQRRPRRSAGLGFSKLRPTKSPPTISSPASASMDNLADFMTMLPTSQSNQPASDFDSALGLSIPDMKGPSNMFGLDLGIPLPESPNLSHLPRTTLLLPPPYTPFNIATAESSGPSSAAPAQLRDVLLEQFDWDTLTEFINAQLPAQSRSPAPDGAVQ